MTGIKERTPTPAAILSHLPRRRDPMIQVPACVRVVPLTLAPPPQIIIVQRRSRPIKAGGLCRLCFSGGAALRERCGGRTYLGAYFLQASKLVLLLAPRLSVTRPWVRSDRRAPDDAIHEMLGIDSPNW